MTYAFWQVPNLGVEQYQLSNQCKHQQLCAHFLSQGQFCSVDGLKSA